MTPLLPVHPDTTATSTKKTKARPRKTKRKVHGRLFVSSFYYRGVAVCLVAMAWMLLRLGLPAKENAAATRGVPYNPHDTNNTMNRSTDDAPRDFLHCTTHPSCLPQQAHALARVWTRRNRADWCGGPNTSTPHPSPILAHNRTATTTASESASSGLWLVKVPKSASSTIAGIALRIGALHQCPVRWEHATAAELTAQAAATPSSPDYHPRTRTFWVAPIRHPLARTLSSVYYHTVSLQAGRTAATPSDAHIVRQMDRSPANYVANYTRVSFPAPPGSAVQTVQEIVAHYDFLLVVEEMEASLVVWAWLADLRLADMLPMMAKASGSWYATGRRCVALVPPVVTPAVTEYWETTGRHRHGTDLLLHAAAVLSLHKTIQQGMGEALFAQRLAEFRDLQAFVDQACSAVFAQSMPCSATGVYQPQVAQEACFLRDFGCGHQCVDDAVQRYYRNATTT